MSGDDRSGPFTVSCSVPQGSVLGLMEFISYTEDVVELCDCCGLSHHLFADDKVVVPFLVSFMAVTIASRPGSVSCKNSAHHAGFNSMLPDLLCRAAIIMSSNSKTQQLN